MVTIAYDSQIYRCHFYDIGHVRCMQQDIGGLPPNGQHYNVERAYKEE